MTPDSPFFSDSRREFVKKSLATSIVAAQPTLLAGLLRADGGGGGGGGTTHATTIGTTNPWDTATTIGTTDPWSTATTIAGTIAGTSPSTTDPWETGTTIALTSLGTTIGQTSPGSTATTTTAPQQPYLRCTKAPLKALNTPHPRQEKGDKFHGGSSGGTWLLHSTDTHGIELTLSLLGVSVGWEGKSAQCIVSAKATSLGEEPIGETEWAGSKNIVTIDETGATPSVKFTPMIDDAADDEWEGTAGFSRYLNVYTKISSGVVQSVYSKQKQKIDGGFKWEEVENDYPVAGLYWEFEIIYK